MNKTTIKSMVSVGDEVVIKLHTSPKPLVGKIEKLENTMKVRTDPTTVRVIGYQSIKEIKLI